MQNNIGTLPKTKAQEKNKLTNQLAATTYDTAEQEFITLLEMEDLDKKVAAQPEIAKNFESKMASAIAVAFQGAPGEQDAAHLFLGRVLYRINRLKLFWYDDLRRYTNERSAYLRTVRDRIEEAWQQWELTQLDLAAIQQIADVKQALVERAAADLNPPLSEDSRYLQEQMTETGYRRVLAIGSFDGLVEGSRLSRVLGGAANQVQCMLTRVLLEEYGNGRFPRKHSTYFAQMLAEFGMNTEPEGYFDLVPWEVLACANHNFLLTECKRYFLRYSGGLTYFEVAGPAAYRNYLAAAQRLRLSDAASGYWELHIREDERHGQWMLDEVALPLVEMYPDNAWQLVLGYDQEKLMGDRAGAAVVRSARQAEQSE
jgi:hypothetical protein